MTTTWRESAERQLEELEPGWTGLWQLLCLTSHAAFALSLRQPLGTAVDLAFAAVDLGEAREELEWARPALTQHHSTRLDQLLAGDDVEDARRLLGELVATAIQRALTLNDAAPDETEALAHVLRRLDDAARQFARPAA